ncbi:MULTISPECIES: 23S rRNA (guanosine(2251)-2'-O)-methyltransferase RlmB [Motilimonas]|uniref:23S rRNA (guanosine-2'-O-)-methyltransferase RlmB n=1 Tax=Motilimonas cestriensis TaxID=2742685 RepID=A0ABS8W7T9_9GAMM|nr:MULTISPECIES: 23S rRNA (guanosine(2251)-2'-O)-methyltransferase RlmB [Motilimonas]MCE0557137.1 23S rRNA (guanosine(2251)-2'-O)-methyltransferase RlmB [Motilimonas sp. E26]MCE2595051.1 23S rRNA (guanosine(2251)-2'-O)-methyltransferase RlmB [Motilimonas cestriensis]MDO6524372.1 23S rRNA (guanosine(2251)-2'-O)-methyltransferase RlmB [Motilimonas sp. 1_MG-2023]
MSKSELIYGIHAVEATLENNPERIIEVYALKGRQDERMLPIIQGLQRLGVSVQFMQRKALDDKTDGGQHQGIIARVKAAPVLNEGDLDDILKANDGSAFLLILDGVTDPHNLGACLRSADAAGVHAVVVPKDKSASLTPTVRKVACGAAESIPLIQVTNLARTLRELKEAGVWLYGAAGEATQTLYETKLTGPVGLVMGAEGAGLRRLTREHCDELISLPMAGSVSSLNVSVATGICLFEVVRQRAGYQAK